MSVIHLPIQKLHLYNKDKDWIMRGRGGEGVKIACSPCVSDDIC